MQDVTRRGLIGGLAAAGLTGAATAAPTMRSLAELKKEADVACVYHCDFGDRDRMLQLLNNVSNHYAVYGGNPFDVQLVIVAHSAGIKFFLDNWEGTPWAKQPYDKTAFDRAESLSKNGLRVYLCEITLKRSSIPLDRIRQSKFIEVVPSGVATVAALQTKGFAYIKVQ